CTDGLVDGLYNNNIVEFLRPNETASINDQTAGVLVKEALARSGRDNTTALVVQVA
ncbi:MAG TPA: serine/threonine-protein phosphatase, partial [Verrucomicrobiales bacterium]|nr:serine/threonine-protein phosphatase [Verrucomicrobiales bacterium]